jgi:hypothetical protein
LDKPICVWGGVVIESEDRVVCCGPSFFWKGPHWPGRFGRRSELALLLA